MTSDQNGQRWTRGHKCLGKFTAFAFCFLAFSLPPAFPEKAESDSADFAASFRSFLPTDLSQAGDKEKAFDVLKQIAHGDNPGQSNWNLLSTLRKGHPRLLILDDDLPAIERSIETDPVAKGLYAKVKAKAEKMLSEPPAEYIVVDGEILRQSRNALKRITTLSGMYRLSHDMRYFKRAREEMLHVSAFNDWHPIHFLDTAELTNALAIGYDWLYAQLSPDDRQTIKNAIAHKGLEAGIADYEHLGWWTVVSHNWNIVCNGGLIVGALSVADEEPETASRVLATALVSSSRAFKSFAPDGGWPEGPMYWNYATRYATFMMASLDTALGTNFGLEDSEGFSQTGLFRIYTAGPTRFTFNFADADLDMDRAWQMFWLSRRFKQTVFAGSEMPRAEEITDIFHLLFFTNHRSTPEEANLPLNKKFTGVNVALLRQSWSDPNSFFVGFKGGDNKANHGHLDLGTFVLDALGARWALDLGSDKYSLPGYFGKNRSNYYRIRSEGHNTLTIGRNNQRKEARAKIVEFSNKPGSSFAIADLTEAYEELKKVRRGILLWGGKQVFVQDEIETAGPASLIWHMHTAATVTLMNNGRSATLTQKTKGGELRMLAEILAPPTAVFLPEAIKVPEEESQEPEVTDLTIPLQLEPAGSSRLLVRFSAEPAGSPEIKALQDWGKKW